MYPFSSFCVVSWEILVYSEITMMFSQIVFLKFYDFTFHI